MAIIIHKSSTFSLLTILISTTLCLASTASSSVDPATAYDVLEDHGLPRGILPEGVDSYLLRSDGSFDAYLADECVVEVRGSTGDRVYLLEYKRKVRGVLDSGSIKKMHGVHVKVLLAWVRIDAVVVVRSGREGPIIRFEAGPGGLLRADFPLAQFDRCPRCRRGFDHCKIEWMGNS